MTRYGPETQERTYFGKFVRRGESFALGPNNDLKAKKHLAIATEAGMAEGSEDAGILEIALSDESDLLGRVNIRGVSDSMSLPRTRDARRRTGEILGALYTGFEVTVDDSQVKPPETGH